MRVNSIDNNYKQNFKALSVKPAQGNKITPEFENLANHFIQGYGFITKKGTTQNGDEVLLLMSTFKYKPSIAEYLKNRFLKHASASVEDIADEKAQKFIDNFEKGLKINIQD